MLRSKGHFDLETNDDDIIYIGKQFDKRFLPTSDVHVCPFEGLKYFSRCPISILGGSGRGIG